MMMGPIINWSLREWVLVMSDIPPGFERCPVCGEFNGTTRAKYLSWDGEPPASVGSVELSEDLRADLREMKRRSEATKDPEREVKVTCLCQGPLCKQCGVTRIHRPGSNSYSEKTRSVGHWALLLGMFPCRQCRGLDEKAKERRD